MFQALGVLSSRLVNLVRSLCIMVYSSRTPWAYQNKVEHPASRQEALRGSRQTKEWKTTNRNADDEEFNAYFQRVFDNAEYERKDQDEIRLNEAKIPKVHHHKRQHRVAKKESKLSMSEIKVQLQHKNRRRLHRSTSQILGIEKRDKIPKVILRRAKKQREELNPEMFAENSRPPRLTRSTACLFTQSHAAENRENEASSSKKGIGAKITRNSEKHNKGILKEAKFDIQRTKSGRLVKKIYRLCL